MDRGQEDVLEYSEALPQIAWMKMVREKRPIPNKVATEGDGFLPNELS